MSRFILSCVICVLLMKIVIASSSRAIISNTDQFFDNLKQKYENTKFNENIKALIDQEINHYVNIISRQQHVDHSKEEFGNSNIKATDDKVFNSIKEIVNLNLSNVKDIKFFKHYIGYEQWFAATLTSTNMTIHQIQEGKLISVITYPVDSASTIHIGKFYDTIIIIVQQLQRVRVFSFNIQDRQYSIVEIQNIDFLDVEDVALLSSSNQLLLGISSSSMIQPYYWLDNTFVPLPRLSFGANRLHLWHFDSTILLVASNVDRSLIFEYSNTARLFLPVQSLHTSFLDASLVNPNSEALLALAGPEYTVVYKRIGSSFTPLQQLGSADRLILFRKDATVLALLVKDEVLEVYQYDGWRFVKLNYRLYGVSDLKVIVFGNERLLLVKWFDDNWTLNRINWMERMDPADIIRGLRQWAAEAVKEVKEFQKSDLGVKSQIKLSGEQVQSLKVKKINGLSIENLKNLKERYDNLINRLSAANDYLIKIKPDNVLHLSSLKARKARIQCKDECNAEKLITKLKCDDFSKLHRIDDATQDLKLERVRLDELKGFPCPVLGLKLQEINTKGSVNGLNLTELEENVLRTSGDQVITGELSFSDLRVSELTASNFEAASTRTRQRLLATEMQANELTVRSGGLLLPLDGEPTVATGRLVAEKARFAGLVHLRGHIGGRAGRKILPTAHFEGRHRLTGDYVLEAARVAEMLAAEEIVRSNNGTTSLTQIAKRVLTLSDNVIPMKMIFDRDSAVWTNVTLEKLPNWLTKKNSKPVKVTGKKIALNDVRMPADLYATLPPPKINAHLCTAGAIATDIRSSTITVGMATAKIIESDEIVGANDLCNTLTDSASSLDEVDLSRKSFTGTVYVDNLNITDLENSPFHGFSKAIFEWHQPDVVKGSFEVEDLKVNSLNAMQGIKIPFPASLENMVIHGNLQVNTINNIYLDSFAKNIIKLDDVKALKNVTFVHLDVDEIETANTNVELQEFGDDIYLGNKIINGNVYIEEDFSIPNLLPLPSADKNVTYVIDGSIKFDNEPEITRINGENLSKLFSHIWMLDRPANLIGNFMLKNVTLTQPLESYELMSTPDFGSWKSLENRLLSKTKSQTIDVPIHFMDIKVSNVFSPPNVILHSSDPYLNDLLNNSVKNTANQTIKEKWRIDKLIVEGELTLHGKINNLNLSTDIVRHGGKNEVRGNKIVNELAVQNLNGLNFGEWANDAVMLNNPRRLITVTGKKSFDTLNARILNVSGTVNGRRLENLLLKTGDQSITGSKIVKGSIHASTLIFDGLINDVNMTEFAGEQLKKYEPIQTINSEVSIKGNIQILGDLKVAGKFNGIELTRRDETSVALKPLLKNIAHLKSQAIKLKTAIKHRAKYWITFEEVDDMKITVNNTISTVNGLYFPKLGNCVLLSLYELSCESQQAKLYIRTLARPSDIIINRLLSIEGIPAILQISSGQRGRISLHLYNYATSNFNVAANIRAPGIIEAATASLEDVIWVVARLGANTLVARYEPWAEPRKFYLTASRLLALIMIPGTHELVLLRDDGFWRLDGLAGPKLMVEAELATDWDWAEALSTQDGQAYVRLGCSRPGCNRTKLLRPRYVGV